MENTYLDLVAATGAKPCPESAAVQRWASALSGQDPERVQQLTSLLVESLGETTVAADVLLPAFVAWSSLAGDLAPPRDSFEVASVDDHSVDDHSIALWVERCCEDGLDLTHLLGLLCEMATDPAPVYGVAVTGKTLGEAATMESTPEQSAWFATIGPGTYRNFEAVPDGSDPVRATFTTGAGARLLRTLAGRGHAGVEFLDVPHPEVWASAAKLVVRNGAEPVAGLSVQESLAQLVGAVAAACHAPAPSPWVSALSTLPQH